ncbi:FMN-binding glutamate synthase family protein, partial [bacterium]|nr:FMN-binding glutamate synthase family protein [bacterium]
VFSSLLLVVTLSYSVVGAYDLLYSPHTLNRLYPVVAYIRYFLENFRTEIHQYFIADNIEEMPFSREDRTLVYRRAKGIQDTIAFGTEHDIYEPNYLSIWHSMLPVVVRKDKYRVLIGGENCQHPYLASRLNISAMSFGSLSANAIEALNRGAKISDCYHNTGEGGISPYHLKHGGDLVWQIGTASFGCCDESGAFDAGLFSEKSQQSAVKMIEIKMSQGAKPGHGGVLPAAKITDEIAAIRGIKKDVDCVSPPVNENCETPTALLQFVQQLRELSGGKPVGFKLCVGNPIEFLAICKAMIATGIKPDFITIDGAEGGTGAAPVEFSNRLGMGVLESVYFVHNALVGCNLRSGITLIASAKTATGFDLLNKLALGADVVNAARTMMLSLGCIQSQVCNTNACPTGIATQDPVRGKALDVMPKSQRVANFQKATLHSFFELLGAMGLDDPGKLLPQMIKRRSPSGLLFSTGDYFNPLHPGVLLDDDDENSDHWNDWWQAASVDSYVPTEIIAVKHTA